MTKIVFLDRDGVINKFPGRKKYVTKVKDFHFIKGAREAIKALSDQGVVIFVISNQQGVGKGIYSKDKLKRINTKMLTGINTAGGKIKRVFYCTHLIAEECECRKPEIDSIVKGLKIAGKTLAYAKNTYFVGDAFSDIEAGKKAGCKTIFVLSGRNKLSDLKKSKCKPDYISKNLLEATKILLNS